MDGGVSLMGGGMKLTAPNLKLEGVKNSLVIDGAGQMELPLSEIVQGQAPASPGTLTVTWGRRMHFDGHKAHFEDSVVAATQQQSLETQTMDVTLQRPIRFTDDKSSERPQVEEIQCFGGAMIKSRSYDPDQQLSSFDQLSVTDLIVNRRTGEILGGPGWLNSVHFKSSDITDGPLSKGNTTAAGTPPPNQLFCLHVQFQKSLTGNLGDTTNFAHGWLRFSDAVWTTYGPVDKWDASLTTHDPSELGPDGIVAKCDRLTIARTPSAVDRHPSFELEALGNTKVYGIDFTAVGHRITYDQDKDKVILEGDGRNNAELWREQPSGRDHTAAQQFSYSRKTKKVGGAGVQSLEFGPLRNTNGK